MEFLKTEAYWKTLPFYVGIASLNVGEGLVDKGMKTAPRLYLLASVCTMTGLDQS